MAKTFTAAHTKSHFAESLRQAEAGEIIEITRYGKPVAAMVGKDDLDMLRRLRAATSSTGLAAAIGKFDDGDEFADAVDRVVASRVPISKPIKFDV